MTDRERLAAEHALRLLEGEELLEARRLEATDPAFEREVRMWEARVAPLFDEVAPLEPAPAVWDRIQDRLGGSDAGANVLQWRRRVRRWQGVAAFSTAAAAALALVAVTPVQQPQPRPQPRPPAAQAASPVLVATLAIEGSPGAVSVTYLPTRSDLLVSAASLQGAAGHDHELWVVPARGAPVSLGIVRAERPLKQHLSPALAALLRTGAGVALSVEPSGGSPTGRPTGPVIASGSLHEV